MSRAAALGIALVIGSLATACAKSADPNANAKASADGNALVTADANASALASAAGDASSDAGGKGDARPFPGLPMPQQYPHVVWDAAAADAATRDAAR